MALVLSSNGGYSCGGVNAVNSVLKETSDFISCRVRNGDRHGK